MLGYFRRIYVPGKIDVGSPTTKASGINASTATITVKGLLQAVETKTSPAALLLTGVSLINASTNGTSAFTLGPPGAANIGMEKVVIWTANALSTRVITLATTATFYNSSAKTFATVTGKTRLLNAPPYCRLVAATAVKWAVTGTNLSSAFTLS